MNRISIEGVSIATLLSNVYTRNVLKQHSVSEIEVFALSHKHHILRIDSVLLNGNQLLKMRNLCQFDDFKKWYLVYRANTDGFQAQNFHEK